MFVERLILVSGGSETELKKELENLKLAATENGASMEGIVQKYNTHEHKSFRAVIRADSLDQLIRNLEQGNFRTAQAPAQPPSVGFMFSAQGSQYFGMLRPLYDTFPVFRHSLDKYEQLVKKVTGEGFKEGIWEKDNFWIVHSQAVFVCLQMALVDLWRSFGVTPQVVMGHSFGEFGAAVYAGAMTLEDAVAAANDRFRLIRTTGAAAMMGVGGSEDEVNRLMLEFEKTAKDANDWLDVCAVNSPEEVLVSGPKQRVEAFEQVCNAAGLRTRPTGSPFAFHSRAMDPIMSEFEQSLNRVKYSETLSCSYISATYGREVESEELNADYWLKHLRQTMHCGKALVGIWEKAKILIEIGPREILVHKARENIRITTKDEENGLILASVKRQDPNCFYENLAQLFLNGVNIKLN